MKKISILAVVVIMLTGVFSISSAEPNHGRLRIEYFPQFHAKVPETIGTFSIRVLREQGTDGDVSVDVVTEEFVNVPASANIDYVPSSSTIYFANGDNTPQFFSVKIIDNNTIASITKGFFIRLQDLSGGAQLADTDAYAIFIRDDEAAVASPPTVPVSPPSVLAEKSGSALSKNIFSPSKGQQAEISYSLSSAGPIEIVIYDRLGREVLQVASRDEAAGARVQTWDGHDSTGEMVKAGMYTAFIKENGHPRRLKIIVLD